MSSSKSKPVRILILLMLIIVIAGVLIARSYYGSINRAVDPRITHARELYSQYDQLAASGDFHGIINLLDSIVIVYSATEHYRNSFETGVIENNRAAALLTVALYKDSITREKNPFYGLESDSIVNMAREHALKAISIYESWGQGYEGLNDDEIGKQIEPGFKDGFTEEEMEQVEKYHENRAQEIQAALKENDRRLSVCHTNLGVIYRLQENYVDAVKQYEMALSLWDRNLDAENNLNKLLNKPMKKRNLLQKLFPPEKEE